MSSKIHSSLAPQAESADAQSKRNIQAVSQLEFQALERRSRGEKISDTIVYLGGRMWVIVLHAIWFGTWVVWNLSQKPGLKAFDPFPFPALATAVSLEAIFLSLFILVSQNRASRRADERAHLDLQVNLLAEREATKVLHLVKALCVRLEIKEASDMEVTQLLKETQPADIASQLEQELPSETNPKQGGPG
ncbi:MAG: DUF1003 domain-containing protein [Acidobacteriota bacterium]